MDVVSTMSTVSTMDKMNNRISGRALAGGAVAVRAMEPQGWGAALGGASEDLRAALERIDNKAWYPADFLLELLGCAEHACAQRPSSLRELARRTVHTDAGSAMEPVVRVMSPTWASRHAQSVWRQYADFGTIRFVEGTMHWAKLEVDVDAAIAPRAAGLWCWLAGALEGVLQIAGAQEVVVSHREGARAGLRDYDLRWG